MFFFFFFLFLQGTDDPQLSKADKSKALKDESKHSINTSIKEAAAKDTGSSDSSEDESTEKVNDSGDSEVTVAHMIS